MNRRSGKWLAVCVSIVATTIVALVPWGRVSAQGGAEPRAGRAPHDEVIARLERAIRYELRAKQLPAFSIALVSGDERIWSAGYGFEDAARTRPASSKTIYRVGSVSKLFTDIGVMQLVERGVLDLDAPMTELLPEFHPENPFGVPATLRQFMSHLSGLVREPPVGHYFDPTEPTLRDTVLSLNRTRLVYRPGTRTKYSNAAVSVVGYVLAKQTGMPFDEYIARHVIAPMGMKATSFRKTQEVREHLATAYMWSYDGRRFEAPTFLLGTAPAGNLYSTVDDLAEFIRMVLNRGRGRGGRVLKAETLQQMTAPQPGPHGKPSSFGIGFHVQQLDGQTKIGHGGAVYGFSTQVEILPEARLGVAAVAALDGSNGVVRRIADYALRLMRAAKAGKPLPVYATTQPVSRSVVRAVAGRYRGPRGVVELTELGGRLTLRRGVLEMEVRQTASGRLIVDSVFDYGTPIERRGEDIVVGQDRYERTSDMPADVPRRWRDLIGEYGWDHNTLFILEDSGRLYALIEWFFYYPLTEIARDVFAFPDYGMYHGEQLHFRRDDDGRVVKVIAAGVDFRRRDVGTARGKTFRIEPVRPVEELRRVALKASPPEEKGPFRKADWVDLAQLDPTIKLDIRYATKNNFMGAVFYQQARAFMQRPAAEALLRVHRKLKQRGLGLMIHDAYRPWHVTRMFWDATPASMKRFVANPTEGSRHNRGCAVDLTLYDVETGRAVEMVSGYDEFSARSYPAYPGGTARQRWYRRTLREAMEQEGFEVYEFEWWHFDYRDWRHYAIHNETFEAIGGRMKDGE